MASRTQGWTVCSSVNQCALDQKTNKAEALLTWVIPTLAKLRKENHKFKVNLGYIVTSHTARAMY